MRASRSVTTLLIFLIIGSTIVFHWIGWLQPVELFFRGLIVPTSSRMYQWTTKAKSDQTPFDRIEDLHRAYLDLEDAYTRSLVDQVRLRRLEEENQALRQQLGFIQAHHFDALSVEIIGKNIDPIGSTLLLPVGAPDRISIGDPVIVGDGILVGVISQVELDISIVRLLDDAQSKVAATLYNKEKSIGVVEGGHGRQIQMNFIPQNEVVDVGTLVVTSGLESTLPAGLLLGMVETVEQEPYQPFQQATLRPPVVFRTIERVSVLRQASVISSQ